MNEPKKEKRYASPRTYYIVAGLTAVLVVIYLVEAFVHRGSAVTYGPVTHSMCYIALALLSLCMCIHELWCLRRDYPKEK